VAVTARLSVRRCQLARRIRSSMVSCRNSTRVGDPPRTITS
jgi:hypothetical protein